MHMKDEVLSFFGLGYVGLTGAVCFASRGFRVIGFDIDRRKVELISSGKPPFYEPQVEGLLREALERGLLSLTHDPIEAIKHSDITFITVGTPSNPDGSINLEYVKSTSIQIGGALKRKSGYHLVVVRSTVVPGTTENIVKPIIESYSGKKCGEGWGLCSNPEFLREGSAVKDTFNPDRIIIGELDKASGEILEKLYRGFYGDEMPETIRTSPVNAELAKYANNAFLAMKISFINMIASLCQKIPGADVEVIAEGIGLDKRIGPLFLKAGAGWGGSCFRKDVEALIDFALKNDVELPLLEAALKVNNAQPYRLVEMAKELVGELGGKRISVLGLAFKPGTDDMRDAVSIKIVKRLLEEGARVVVHDPKAVENARKIFGDAVEYAESIEDCLRGSECAIIVTEWEEFRGLKPQNFIELMKIPAVVDGRRIYDAESFSSKLRFAAVGLGEKRYYNPALAANAIIRKNNSILLVKRSIEPFKGSWSLPGGFVEHDETVEESLVREVEEETGLKVKPLRVIGVFSHPLRSPVKHVVTICYESMILGGELKAQGEIAEAGFFPMDSLPELAFDHEKILREYFKSKNTSCSDEKNVAR
jgi:UDPglucose 6-dehydrogenase